MAAGPPGAPLAPLGDHPPPRKPSGGVWGGIRTGCSLANLGPGVIPRLAVDQGNLAAPNSCIAPSSLRPVEEPSAPPYAAPLAACVRLLLLTTKQITSLFEVVINLVNVVQEL